MKKKMWPYGRIIKVALAIIILALYWTNIITGMLALVLVLIMGILIIAIFIGFWPIYYPFRESTTKKPES